LVGCILCGLAVAAQRCVVAAQALEFVAARAHRCQRVCCSGGTGVCGVHGLGVPAQRTVWMLGVVTLLRVYGLRWPWVQVWLSVCAVVLALDPWALMQAGFWLSFVAVGVLFASGSHAPASTLWAAAQRMWREQWLMSVCLAPLTLLLFHQVSVVGLFANMVAVPWVTLVVTPLCLLGLVLPFAWGMAAEALQWLVWGLKACAGVS